MYTQRGLSVLRGAKVSGVLSAQYLRYNETDKEENWSPAETHGNTWSAGDHLRKSSLVGSISSSVPT